MSASTSQIRFAAVTLAWVLLVPATTHAQVAPVSPGALRTYSTIYSIGLEHVAAMPSRHKCAFAALATKLGTVLDR